MDEPPYIKAVTSGHLLAFANRRRDRDGWAIWYKRLEAGTFQFPLVETGRKEIAAWVEPMHRKVAAYKRLPWRFSHKPAR